MGKNEERRDEGRGTRDESNKVPKPLSSMSDVERIIEQVKLFCPNVAKLPKQLTAKEIENLLKNYSKNEIIHQLNQMENYRPLTKKYNSVYLTLKKWFDIDVKKGFLKPAKAAHDGNIPHSAEPRTSEFYKTLNGVVENIKKGVPKYQEHTERQKIKDNFLKKYPVGSFIRSNTGTEYEVFDFEFLKEINNGEVLPIAYVANHHFSLIKRS